MSIINGIIEAYIYNIVTAISETIKKKQTFFLADQQCVADLIMVLKDACESC